MDWCIVQENKTKKKANIVESGEVFHGGDLRANG